MTKITSLFGASTQRFLVAVKEILKLNGCGGCYPEMSDLARCTETQEK